MVMMSDFNVSFGGKYLYYDSDNIRIWVGLYGRIDMILNPIGSRSGSNF
jgi:hypothetical protein